MKLYRGIGADTKAELDKYIKDFYDPKIEPNTYGGGANLGQGYYFSTDKREAEQYAKSNDYKEWKYSKVIEIEVDDKIFMDTSEMKYKALEEISPEFARLKERYNTGMFSYDEGEKIYKQMINAEDKAMKDLVLSKGYQGVGGNGFYNIMTNDFLNDNKPTGNVVKSSNIKAIKPPTYWQARAEQRIAQSDMIARGFNNDVQKVYDATFRNIQKEIDEVYKKIGKNGILDKQELKQFLTLRDSKQIKADLLSRGIDPKMFGNYNARLTRLQELQANIMIQAKDIYPVEQLKNIECYEQVINSSYYRAMYDAQMGTGVGFSFSELDPRVTQTILSTNWQGGNFSSRIWKNTDVLANLLSEIVGAGVMSGISHDKMSRQIMDRFNTNKYYAERLIRTETSHFNNEADALVYKELGVEEYVFDATLDSRTSNICQDRDNKRYKVSKREVGKNAPPMHPNCRSTTHAFISEDVEASIERRARDPKTNKTYTIKGNPSYKEWLKSLEEVVPPTPVKPITPPKVVTPPVTPKVIQPTVVTPKVKNIYTIKGKDYDEVIFNMDTFKKSGISNEQYEDYLLQLNLAENRDIQNLYLKYGDSLDKIKIKTKGGSYHAHSNSMLYDININNGKHRYSTIAHEYGHAFDHLGKYDNLHHKEITALKNAVDNKILNDAWFEEVASSSDEFLEAIRKDKILLANKMKTDPDFLSNLRADDMTNGVQDVIDGLFKGVRVNWGHGEPYFNKKFNDINRFSNRTDRAYIPKIKDAYLELGLDASNQDKIKDIMRQYSASSECWAHISSAVVCESGHIEAVMRDLPNSYKAYCKIIKGVK